MKYIFVSLTLLCVPAWAGMNRQAPGFPAITMFGQNFDNNHFSAMCVDCHSRTPSAYTPSDNAGLGTHFVYGGPSKRTGTTTPEKTTAWTSGGLSKYGNFSTLRSVTGQVGEIICESCHNMLVNTGENKLLVQDNVFTDPSPLCEGCHGETGPSHHLMTGDTSTIYNRTLQNADDAFVRNPPLAGSEAVYPGSNALNCQSCHKPHDAQTQTGARILRRGYSSGGGAVLGVSVTGLDRQTDIDNTGNTRLVTEFEPLCNACHKVSF